jgi:predicted NBD/HSP70 family sugar kinase
MSKAKEREQKEQEQQKNRAEDLCEALNALIAEQVVHLLGKPENLHLVQVRQLWENYFRVNVLIGPDAASVRVANSYFLKADREGNIVESTPKIIRQYALRLREAADDSSLLPSPL